MKRNVFEIFMFLFLPCQYNQPWRREKTCPSFVTHELNGRLSRRRQQKKKGKCKSFFSLRTSNAPSSYQISRLTSGYKLILRALSFKTLNYYDNALRANYKAQGPVIVHSTTI